MTTATLVTPGTYRIDPRTTVRFTVTHAFGWKPVQGTFAVRGGSLVADARPERSTVTVELDAASFTTDEPRRDADITGRKFLDAAAHPVITFTGSGFDGDTLRGTLTVRGRTSPVTLTVTDARAEAGGWRCRATTRIDRHAAGVTAGRGIIARNVDVEIDVYATR